MTGNGKTTMRAGQDQAKRYRAASLRAGGLSYREIGIKLKVTTREARQLVMSGLTRKGVSTALRSLLTTQQAADLASVHINTLRRWGDLGLIKQFRIGPRGDRRFLRRDVEKLLVKTMVRRRKKTGPKAAPGARMPAAPDMELDFKHDTLRRGQQHRDFGCGCDTFRDGRASVVLDRLSPQTGAVNPRPAQSIPDQPWINTSP